jgi:hypothetical protein
LRQAAREILEEEGLAALSLRSVARRAGRFARRTISATMRAVKRCSFDVRRRRLAELRGEIAQAAAVPTDRAETIRARWPRYMRFAVRHAGLLRLMFGTGAAQPHRVPRAYGRHRPQSARRSVRRSAISAAGLAVWSTIHGLAILILENVIDLGQTQAGMDVVPSRAEIILRGLTEASQLCRAFSLPRRVRNR